MGDLHIYVAGPITSDPLGGTRAAIQAAYVLSAHGFVPYVPHLSVLWEMVAPQPYEEWMRLSLAWLRKCDALLRLPGESKGADVETAEARALGIPVLYSVAEVVAWASKRREATNG